MHVGQRVKVYETAEARKKYHEWKCLGAGVVKRIDSELAVAVWMVHRTGQLVTVHVARERLAARDRSAPVDTMVPIPVVDADGQEPLDTFRRSALG
jgi:hypothetical protein